MQPTTYSRFFPLFAKIVEPQIETVDAKKFGIWLLTDITAQFVFVDVGIRIGSLYACLFQKSAPFGDMFERRTPDKEKKQAEVISCLLNEIKVLKIVF